MEDRSVRVRNGGTVRSGGQPEREPRFAVPAADIYETPEAYVLMLDLPGAVRQAMTVRLEKGTLLVTAPVDAVHRERATVLHREHTAAGFERAFALGGDVNRDNIDAQFEDGVLTVKLYKAEQVKPREIAIR